MNKRTPCVISIRNERSLSGAVSYLPHPYLCASTQGYENKQKQPKNQWHSNLL